MTLSFFLRTLRREVRTSGRRLWFFLGCLAVGVGAVTGVAALTDALEESLRDRSREILGADLVVSGRRPIPDALHTLLPEIPYERTDVREVPTLVRGGDNDAEARSHLVELKVLAGRYPLYGGLQVTPPGDPQELLAADRVLVAPELLIELRLARGDPLFLGGVPFQIAGAVTEDSEVFNFSPFRGPRVFVSDDALARTELLGRGSRIRYRALFRFPEHDSPGQLAALKAHLLANLPQASYFNVETHSEGQPGIRQALERLERFLGIVALLSLLLGGIGIAQVVRTWLSKKIPAIAIQRCLGFRPRDILMLYLGHVLLLAVAGSCIGCTLGSVVPAVVPWFAGERFADIAFNSIHWGAILRGALLGLGITVVFSLPALTAVWRVPPLRVLRSDVDLLPPRRWLQGAMGLVLFVGIFTSAYTQGGEALRSLYFTGGLFAITGVLFVSARVVLRLTTLLKRVNFQPYVKHGLAALARPGAGTTGSIVALGLGVMVLFTVQLVKIRLEGQLSTALPAEAPSTYIWDIQPTQRDGVVTLLRAAGADNIKTVPVVNCRLSSIDGRSVEELVGKTRDRSRTRWVFTREQRITWLSKLPADNKILAGELWMDPDRAEISLEEGFAADLGTDLGSTLVFDVQGVPVKFTVTTIREVTWRSFGINFFLVAEPGVLEEVPHTLLAAARMTTEAEQNAQNRLSVEYPNATQIRVRPILEKLVEVFDRVAFAVSLLGSFTVLTGLIILVGAISATLLERSRETALLKTLGVTRVGIAALLFTEYSVLGLVAGSIGGGAAFLLAGLFLERVMEIPAQLPFWVAPFVALGTAVLAAGCGILASGRALRVRPVETLRAVE